MNDLIQTILLALLIPIAAAAGGLGVAVLNKLRQKFGLEVSAEQDAKVRAAVQNAILSTEERARAEVKKLVEPIAGVAAAKMADATRAVLDAIPGITNAEATTLVNEELPKVRAAVAPAATAFLGQVGAAAAPSLPAPKPSKRAS